MEWTTSSLPGIVFFRVSKSFWNASGESGLGKDKRQYRETPAHVETNIPNRHDNLESLVLGRGDDVLRRMAVARRVRAYNIGQALERFEIGLVVTRRLAAAIRVLVAQGEAQVPASGDSSRQGCHERKQATHTHCERC
jgi:hypothetical protein